MKRHAIWPAGTWRAIGGVAAQHAAWAAQNLRRMGRRAGQLIRQAGSDVADAIYPPACLCCERNLECLDGGGFCTECVAEIRGQVRMCRRCATPLPPAQTTDRDCAWCRPRPYRFKEAIAVGPYQGLLRDAVKRAKRAAHESLALGMGDLLGRVIVENCPEWSNVDCIVPVPMPWTRRLLRGANPAERVAEAVGHRLGRKVVFPLRVSRRTQKQGTLSLEARFHNMHRALTVARGYVLTGAQVLVVDDILTTGATANEAARVLRAAGVAAVRVAVVARAAG